MYIVDDIQKFFSCGKNKAYKIMHDKDMKSFKVGKVYYVDETSLQEWIDKAKRLGQMCA